MISAFSVSFKKSYLPQVIKILLSVLISKSFIVLLFIFRSRIHLELIFEYDLIWN